MTRPTPGDIRQEELDDPEAAFDQGLVLDKDPRLSFGYRAPTHSRLQRTINIMSACSLGLIATGAAPIAVGGGAVTMGAVGTGAAGVTAAITAASLRRDWQSELEAEATAGLARVVGPMGGKLVCSRWRGWFIGTPQRVKFKYHSSAPLPDKNWVMSAADVLHTTLGGRYRVHKHDTRRGLLLFRQVPGSVAPVSNFEVDRATKMVRDMFGSAAQVDVQLGDDNMLIGISVKHDIGVKATFPQWRERVERVVTTMMVGRWRARWDLEADAVEFSIRPEMPTFLTPPVPVTDPEHPDFYRIPLGRNEDGKEICWELNSSQPHCLVTGKTGKGKTNFLRGTAMVLAKRQSFRIWACDPKRIELLSLRRIPNVQIVATTIEEQVALVMHLWELMEERYRQITEERRTESDFEMVVFILDEFAEFNRRVVQWWARIKRPGMPSQCPVLEAFASVVRLGRAAGIRLAIGMQRGDARFFGESAEARDNFDTRLSLGRLSPDGSRMMWGSLVGTSLPGVRGRAIANDPEGDLWEVQTYWTPDPRRVDAASPEHADDQAILERLMPTEATFEPLAISIPDPKCDDKGRPMVWESIEDSTLHPADPDQTTGAESDEFLVYPPDDEEVVGEDDIDSDYQPAQSVQVGDIDVGDLIEVGNRWVVVDDTEVNEFNNNSIALSWRSIEIDTDKPGVQISTPDELLSCRRPIADPGEEETPGDEDKPPPSDGDPGNVRSIWGPKGPTQ